MTRLKFRRGSEERGVTLIETLLVLGIATAFIAGGIGLYNQAQTASENRDAVTDIYSVIAAVRGTFGGNDEYPLAIGNAALGFAAAPTAWTRAITVRGADADGTAGPGPLFEIVIDLDGDVAQCELARATFQQQFFVFVNNAVAQAMRAGALNAPGTNTQACDATNGDVLHIYGT